MMEQRKIRLLSSLWQCRVAVLLVLLPLLFRVHVGAQRPTIVGVFAGSSQSALVGAKFATPLQTLVTDASSNPVAGASVTFTAPASGPSGSFAGSGTPSAVAITNASGVATAPAFTANSVPGLFTVAATVNGVTDPGNFYLANNAAGQGGLNPVPMVDQPLVPTGVAPGGSGLVLTVDGTGFSTGAAVLWDGSPLLTTFMSSSKLQASVPAAELDSAQTATVSVSNPAPGGGVSNGVSFEVVDPAATLAFTAVSQNSANSVISNGVSDVVADFNGDGNSDLAMIGMIGHSLDQNPDGVEVYVRLGNGDGSFQAPVGYPVGMTNPQNLISEDFNGDGIPDLAVVGSGVPGAIIAGVGAVSILLGNGDGTFQAPNTFTTGDQAEQIIAGDFNGDGKLDVATANGGGDEGTVSILLGNGDGTLQNHVDYSVGAPASLAEGDFNGDGNLDLAVLNFQGGVSILLGAGNGTFQIGQTIPTAPSGIDLIAADLNSDGKLDLVQVTPGTVGSPTSLGFVTAILGNGDGTFRAPVDYPVAVDSISVVAADFNGDQKLDLAVRDDANNGCCSSENKISILLGNGDGTFQAPLDIPTGGQGNAMFVGDFNGDGRMDLASGLDVIMLQGAFPAVSAAPDALAFSQQAVGTVSAAQAIALSNSGSVGLTMSGITISGVNSADFSQTNNCGVQLAPSASCEVSVTFSPTAQGTREAAVSIADDVPGSPQIVSLTGSTPPLPVASVAPLSISFPNQYVGTSGLPVTVNLTNTGTATLVIAGVTVSPSDFGELSACGSSLTAGSSCAVGVFFDPTASGARPGVLTINDNAPGSPPTVVLSGIGQDFSLAPTSSATSTVNPGQEATYSIALTPAGGFNQTVTLSCTGVPAAATCQVSSGSVSLDGSTAAPIRVTVMTTSGSGLPPTPGSGARWLQIAMLIFLLIWSGAALSGKRRLRRKLALPALLVCTLALTTCGGTSAGNTVGGNGGAGTPAGTYQLTLAGNFTAGSTQLTRTTVLTLVVK